MKIRELIDRVILSDHEWKKKYCPLLYKAVSEGDLPLTEKRKKGGKNVV